MQKHSQQDQLEFGDTTLTRRDVGDDTRLAADPIADAEAANVALIVDILNRHPDLRERVFRDLHSKQRETLEIYTEESTLNQIASPLAFYREMVENVTAETKTALLETLRAEINGIQNEIRLNEKKASKLMTNAVIHAKVIGDRLFLIRTTLLKHGEYEDWVEDNFNGGLSTARAYTRIAKFENWKKIAPKVHSGTLTIEKALQLIRERGPEKKPDPDDRRPDWIKNLAARFTRTIKTWPSSLLRKMADDLEFMDAIEREAKRRKVGFTKDWKQREAEHRREQIETYIYLREQDAAERAAEQFSASI